MKINENYLNLQESYLFSTIARRVAEFQKSRPGERIIRMGIGDVTLPLCPAVVSAMKDAAAQMGRMETFHGYGPEQGYPFLKEAVQKYYAQNGVFLEENEIFISDGAKSDIGNILDILSPDNTVLIPDPVYPVYLDTNIMAGRKILYMNANRENGFLPLPDESVQADIIYLCSPNNPTGAVYSKNKLQQWVDYALSRKALILFDAAYEAFIEDQSLPRSIYELKGAKSCAIEFCSLSKTAGFTGTRCGYTVVPQELVFDGVSLNRLWLRRQTTKFNGVPYVIQKAAAAVFSKEGQAQIRENLQYYAENAKVMTTAMKKIGFWFTGGENSPYIWMECPDKMDSWAFFDLLLQKLHIVGTPGEGFGGNGKGYFRLTAFGAREDTVEAMNRMAEYFK